MARIMKFPLHLYFFFAMFHSVATLTSTASAFVAPRAIPLKSSFGHDTNKNKSRQQTHSVVLKSSQSSNAHVEVDHDSDNSSSKTSTTPTTTSFNNALLYTSNPTDASYSASDWLHNIKSLPRSSILREIKRPVLTIIVWSSVVAALHKAFVSTGHLVWAKRMCINSTPHSFLVSSLGLLLVFRTNSAYQRFAEGRKIWERILSVSRNLSRLASLYEQDLGTQRKKRVFRMLAAFPYLLQHHIQQDDNNTTDHHGRLYHNNSASTTGTVAVSTNTNIMMDRKSLPWSLLPKATLQKCANSLNRPLWICDRLSHEFTNVTYSPNFTSRERLDFLNQVDKLSQCIGECERIHQTAVPLNYARHSLRSLTLWLFSLPFALIGDLGLLTAPVMGVIAWVLFGTYQIGYQIEDPFQGSLRLSNLCDAIYRDIMMMMSLDTNGGILINTNSKYNNDVPTTTTMGLRESAFTISDMEMKQWEDHSLSTSSRTTTTKDEGLRVPTTGEEISSSSSTEIQLP